MKSTLGGAVIAFWLLVPNLTGGAAKAANPVGPVLSSNIDGSIRAALRRSSVAVLLPASIPRSVGPIRTITVIEAGRTGYYVGYSAVRNCSGGLSCTFFHVAGFPSALRDPLDRRDRPVRLADGQRARFRPRNCTGASCTEASLSFERAGAVYEIDVKAERNDLAVLEAAYRQMRPVR